MNKYIKVDGNTVEIRNVVNNQLISVIDNDEELIEELKKFDWESNKNKEAVTYTNEKTYYLKNIVYLFYYGKENALNKYYSHGGEKIKSSWVEQ